jgi:hypothetical protein
MRTLFSDLTAAGVSFFSADAACPGVADKMNVSVTASNIDADCVILVVVMLFVIFKLDTKYNISTAIYKIPCYECLAF